VSKTHSSGLAEVSQIALLSNLLEHIVRRRCGQGLTSAKYPDTVLLPERTRSADWAKGDLLSSGFDFQGVAGLQMKFLAQELGDYHSTGFIDDETAIHSWYDFVGRPIS